MKIFVDTSALVGVLYEGDSHHPEAAAFWRRLLLENSDVTLQTTNYVVLETMALLQRRYGVEKARLLQSEMLPALDIIWLDEQDHALGLEILFAANRRELSLVDCTSFAAMRRNQLAQVFTFDSHFKEQGLIVLP